MYVEGVETGIVTLDVVGRSEADSGSLSASNKFGSWKWPNWFWSDWT